MRQLLYVSNTDQDFPASELEAILTASRRNNTACGVTGMLLYIDGGFLQVLEGDDDAVAQTFERIRQDRRHWNAQPLLDRAAPRAFANWSMGFQHMSQAPGGSDAVFQISSDAIRGKLKPGAAVELPTLLQTFYRVQMGDNALLAR